jgi:hypothetical protein
MAVAYGQRPSSILGVEGSWEAYQVDLACLTVGRWVEGKLAERGKKGKRLHRLEDLLRERNTDEENERMRAYRESRGIVARKMMVPESGVW